MTRRRIWLKQKNLAREEERKREEEDDEEAKKKPNLA